MKDGVAILLSGLKSGEIQDNGGPGSLLGQSGGSALRLCMRVVLLRQCILLQVLWNRSRDDDLMTKVVVVV